MPSVSLKSLTYDNQNVRTPTAMSADLRILKADLADDLHARWTLELLDAYAQDPMGAGEPLSEFARQHVISGLRTHPGTVVLIAMRAKRGVGLAICFRGFSTFAARPLLNISDFYVDSAARGGGIGRALMAAIEREAKDLGCCKLTLEVQENNSRARSLYAAAQFSRDVHVAEAGGALFLSKPLMR